MVFSEIYRNQVALLNQNSPPDRPGRLLRPQGRDGDQSFRPRYASPVGRYRPNLFASAPTR